MKLILSVFLIMGFILTPAGYCEDQTGQAHTPSLPKNISYGAGANNWEKAVNTQREVDRLTSLGGAVGKLPRTYQSAKVYQGEHSANPLSRPDADPLIAVRQAELARQAAQIAAPAEEEDTQEQE